MLQGTPPVSLFLAAERIIAAYGLHQAWRQGLHVQAQDPAQIQTVQSNRVQKWAATKTMERHELMPEAHPFEESSWADIHGDVEATQRLRANTVNGRASATSFHPLSGSTPT